MLQQQQKPVHETFNDGFLIYGRETTQRSETGKRTGKTFSAEGKLAYKEMSCRDSDYQMAGYMDASLDIKVKTLYPPSFQNISKSKLKVRIGNIEFDVIKVDPDGKRYLYFYLQEVGAVNE
ncbi:head-tail adaptor protein [Metabacillus halosaccharovorans]|uniref:head-tail adaptor protein n=1 Tax=Metabacillus halosaccharovorans TaxID=930124 RepID=UPI00403DCB8D